jgi:hypothetical protein
MTLGSKSKVHGNLFRISGGLFSEMASAIDTDGSELTPRNVGERANFLIRKE